MEEMRVVGGKREQDPKQAEWKPLAELALKHHLDKVQNTEPHEVMEIIHVTTQVVAGTRTDLEFIAAPTGSPDRALRCTAAVWERPWLNLTEIVEISCQPNQ